MKSKQLIMLSFLFMIGCTATKKVTSTTVEPQKTPSDAVAQGKDLYENRCAKCHKLYAASDYNIQRWPRILNSMQYKAKITDQQKELILSYLSNSIKQ